MRAPQSPHRSRSVGVLSVVALVALFLGASSVGAGTTVPDLTIELTPAEAKAGTEVAVRVVGDPCASGTTGALVNSAAPPGVGPDPEVYATVTFADPNNGTFTVPDFPDAAFAPTDVVVECSSAQEQPLSGRANFDVLPPENGLTIIKDVASEGGSTQSFGFAIDGPDDVHNWLVPLSDGGSDPDRFGAAQIGVGTYTVSEAPTSGWSLTSITCDDEAAVVDLAASTATFTLPEDGTVTCTFVNTQTSTPTTVPPAATPAVAAAAQANYTG